MWGCAASGVRPCCDWLFSGDCVTSLVALTRGVPQGSAVGPLLFPSSKSAEICLHLENLRRPWLVWARSALTLETTLCGRSVFGFWGSAVGRSLHLQIEFNLNFFLHSLQAPPPPSHFPWARSVWLASIPSNLPQLFLPIRENEIWGCCRPVYKHRWRWVWPGGFSFLILDISIIE